MSALPCVALDEFNARSASFLRIHRQSSSEAFIRNVRTRVDSVQAGEACLPVTINHAEAGNAWVCSPYTTYCSYAQVETARLGRPALTAPLNGLVRCTGTLLQRAEIDRAVAINNWLVSTNSYPRLQDVAIDQAIDEAISRWPGHAVWFRSLNELHHADWLEALAARGGVLLPSRQVYLFENVAELARRHADLKRDLALLRREGGPACEQITVGDEDFVRAEQLYADLYIHKYSALNPQYRHTWIKAWSDAGLLQLFGLRGSDGVLQGVSGLFGFGNLITSPIVGYDTRLPQSLGLYRRLAACVLREALHRQCLVNLSAGVAHFKRQRGARPAIEYSVVFAGHLPAGRRRAIHALGWLARNVGIPIMRRFKL
ncbi:hypothetical protein [Rhodanobacter sp. DHB23]|uniref:hypothetical protein n=1 Tax=Rhodanobacter sp. DHB23 TaxID=2775923 RepID=UPI00177C4D50|nr:hypothetical protein [Rhodanobacter sp. DHB23]MBD8871308.1 hypothetical protein [Rhodanobacter sp. DHB23]